jgi:hypothetical protein
MCLLNGSISGILPAAIDFKQETFTKTTYTEVDFGPRYRSNYYYVAEKENWKICVNDEFNEHEQYFTKVYDNYVPISISENEYKRNKYYIKNPKLFEQCTKDDFDLNK